MTGFGKATAEINNKKISVEIKSLNSKQADVSVRLPSYYKEKELVLRSLINQELERGKIEFNLYAELMGEQGNLTINKDLFKKYYNELTDVLRDLKEDNSKTDLVAIVSKMPDVFKSEKNELDENEWNEIENIVKEAIVALDNFRKDEGQSLTSSICSVFQCETPPSFSRSSKLSFVTSASFSIARRTFRQRRAAPPNVMSMVGAVRFRKE